MRTCVGCRASGSKGTLLRIVRAGASGATLDLRGSMPGRGAYVHPDPGCVDRAFAKGANAVFRALRTGSDLDAAARLRLDIEGELQA